MNVTLREHPPTCPEPSTDALMLQVQQRDILAFVQLYCRLLPAIKRQAASEGWQASAADDIAQEVFLRLWQNPARFDGQRSAKAYLLGISRNVMRELRKAGAKTILAAEQCFPEPAIEDDPAAAMERIELMQALAAARSELSDNQATALRMVYEQGTKERPAANQLGCTEGAIHERLREGRRKLREFLRARLQLAMLLGSAFGFARNGLSEVIRPAGPRDAGRWLAGTTAMWLIMSAISHPDKGTLDFQQREGGASPPIRLSFGGEGASSPAAHVEFQER